MIKVSMERLRRAASYGLLVLWVSLSFSSALVEISFVFSLVVWLVVKIKKGTWRSLLLSPQLAFPLAAFVFLSVLSLFWSEYPALSIRGIFKILEHILIFWMVADVFQEPKELRRFEIVFVLMFALLIFDAAVQYFAGRDFIRGFHGSPAGTGVRVTASYKSYGLFACYLIMAVPYLTMLGLRLRNQQRSLNRWHMTLMTTFGGIAMLFLTRSRGALLAFVVGLGIFLCLRKKFIFLLILLVLGGSCLAVLPQTMIIHLDKEGKEQSLVERYYLWDRAIHVIRAKPLTGTGINTYTAAHTKYDKTQNWRVQSYYAHNGYLQIAAETGLPSLAFFLFFLFQYFRISLRELSRGKPDPIFSDSTQAQHGRLERLDHGGVRLGLLTGILNFLIFALVDTVMHNPQAVMTFWYVAGLQLAYGRLSLPIESPQNDLDHKAQKRYS